MSPTMSISSFLAVAPLALFSSPAVAGLAPTASAGVALETPSGLHSVAAGSLAGLASAAQVDEEEEAENARAEREAAFAKLMDNVRLVGFFTDSNRTDGRLSKDSYTIKSAHPTKDGKWQFEALVEYRDRPIPIKMELPVEWAGDTPVICVTDMSFPLLGQYSARVLFYDDQYVGVWGGATHGGQMFGQVVPIEDEGAPAADEAGGTDEKPADKQARAGEPVIEEAPATTRRARRASHTPTHPLEDGVDWPSFRGPSASGVSEGWPTPAEWDIESGENIRWRIEVPGLAHSSPIVWGNKVFVTTAIRVDGEQELKVGLYGDIQPIQDDSEFRYEVHCYDKNKGELLWKRESWQGKPPIKRHPKGSYAASTPATDGKRVLAFFGSAGLFCYDMDGEPVWKRDFGTLDSGFFMVPAAQWGFGASPIFHEGKVIVQVDIQKDSFVAALDAATGEILWKTAREEVPTWSTPTVDVREGRSQVICNGWKHIGGYDLETGKELWKLVGGGDIPVPTPIVSHDLIFITNAHGRMAPIYAIDPLAEGTLEMDPETCEAMVWSTPRRGNYMQTPLVVGDAIYFCSDSGILACYDAKTGEERWRERLGAGKTGFTSSGVSADGALYFASEEGDVHVVTADEFELLSVNSLGEECMASPAISEGVLFYRTRGHLVAVGL